MNELQFLKKEFIIKFNMNIKVKHSENNKKNEVTKFIFIKFKG